MSIFKDTGQWLGKLVRGIRRRFPFATYVLVDIAHPWIARLSAALLCTYLAIWASVLVVGLLMNHAAGQSPSLSPATFSFVILCFAMIAIPWFLFRQFQRVAPAPTHRVQETINDIRKWWNDIKRRLVFGFVLFSIPILLGWWLFALADGLLARDPALSAPDFAVQLTEAAIRDVQTAAAFFGDNPLLLWLPFLLFAAYVIAWVMLALVHAFFLPAMPATDDSDQRSSFALRLFTSLLAIFTITFFLVPRLDDDYRALLLAVYWLPAGWREVDGLVLRGSGGLDLKEEFNALELVLTVLTASFAAYASNRYIKQVLESINQMMGDKRLKTIIERMKLPVKSAVGGRQLPNDYPGLVEINASSTASILPHFPSDQSVARIRLQLGGERHHDKSPWSQLGPLLDTAGIDLGKSIVFVYSRKEEARDLVFYCTGAEFKALAGSKDLDPDVCGTKFLGDCLIEALADDDTRTLRDIVQSRRKLFDKRAGESGLICSTYVKDSVPVREVLDVMGRERVDRVLVTSSSEPRELAIVGAAQLGKFLSRP